MRIVASFSNVQKIEEEILDLLLNEKVNFTVLFKTDKKPSIYAGPKSHFWQSQKIVTRRPRITNFKD